MQNKPATVLFNFLTAAVLLSASCICAFYAAVLVNPGFPLNPFPPPTLPAVALLATQPGVPAASPTSAGLQLPTVIPSATPTVPPPPSATPEATVPPADTPVIEPSPTTLAEPTVPTPVPTPEDGVWIDDPLTAADPRWEDVSFFGNEDFNPTYGPDGLTVTLTDPEALVSDFELLWTEPMSGDFEATLNVGFNLAFRDEDALSFEDLEVGITFGQLGDNNWHRFEIGYGGDSPGYYLMVPDLDDEFVASSDAGDFAMTPEVIAVRVVDQVASYTVNGVQVGSVPVPDYVGGRIGLYASFDGAYGDIIMRGFRVTVPGTP